MPQAAIALERPAEAAREGQPRRRGRPPRKPSNFAGQDSSEMGLSRTADGQTVKSARRVLEILEFMASNGAPVTVADVALTLGYPKSSASVLMQTLHDLRYIQPARRGEGFIPTLRLSMVAHRITEICPADELMEVMEDLHDRTGANVALGTENGLYVRCIQFLPSPQPELFVRLGSLRPICELALGRALLLNKTDKEVDLLLRRINVEAPEPHRVDTSSFLQMLDGFREAGHTTSSRGSCGLAVPLPKGRGGLNLALGIIGPEAFIHEHEGRFLELLNEALERIRSAEPAW